ncbi:hypothetical protein [Pseudomonas sp. NPDC099000]|uniref:hypothetical protein n=1 Tax=Pseudomonas sp. NPDC099000 TaxID=3364488 RepID=UPI00383B36C4
MKFYDTLTNISERFSIGIELETERLYVSIPVSNRLVDYEEYYQIDRVAYDLYMSNPTAALDFVKLCRNREVDNLLIFAPGTDRGETT